MNNVTAVNEAWTGKDQMCESSKESSSTSHKDKLRHGSKNRQTRDRETRLMSRPESSDKVTKVKAIAERGSTITVVPTTRKPGSHLNARDVDQNDLLIYSFTFNINGNQDILPFIPYGYFPDKSTNHYEWLVDFKKLLISSKDDSELAKYITIVCGESGEKSEFRNFFVPLLNQVNNSENKCTSHSGDVSIYDMGDEEYNERILSDDTLCTCYWRMLFHKLGCEALWNYFGKDGDLAEQYFDDESHKLCDVNCNVMMTYSYYFKNLFQMSNHYDTLAMISLSEQVIKVTKNVSKFLNTANIPNEVVSATYGKAKDGSRRLYLSVSLSSASAILDLDNKVHECLNQYKFCYFGFLMRYGILNFSMHRYEMKSSTLVKVSDAIYYGPVQMHQMTFENGRVISAYSSPLSNANLMITCLARPLDGKVCSATVSANKRAIMSAVMYYIETNYVTPDNKQVEMKIEMNEDFRLKYGKDLTEGNLSNIYEGLKDSTNTDEKIGVFMHKIVDILFKSMGAKNLAVIDGYKFDVCIIVKKGKTNVWHNSSIFDQWLILPTIVIGKNYFSDRSLRSQSVVSMASGCPTSTEVGVVRFGM